MHNIFLQNIKWEISKIIIKLNQLKKWTAKSSDWIWAELFELNHSRIKNNKITKTKNRIYILYQVKEWEKQWE